MTSAPSVDPDAFRAFEHGGWASAVAAYADGFGSLTSPAIEPLLDAAPRALAGECSTLRADPAG